MQSITLAPAHVHSIASAAAATSKDKMTPVLEHIEVSVAAGILTATATDCRRVARIRFATGDEAAELEPTAISAALLVAFSKALKAAKVVSIKDLSTLTVNDGRVALEHESGIRLGGDVSTQNFPPVGRLIDGYVSSDPRDVYLTPLLIADAAKLSLPADTRPNDAKEAVWFVQFSDSGSSKPGPVLMTREDANPQNIDRIEYMVQPNLQPR